MTRDPYSILQVAHHAEPEVIEAAYKKLALKYHPDQNPSANATAQMQDINWAYEILKDPAKKAGYDRGVRPQAPPKPKPPPPKPKPPPPKPKSKPPPPRPKPKPPPPKPKAEPAKDASSPWWKPKPMGPAERRITRAVGAIGLILIAWFAINRDSAPVLPPTARPKPTPIPNSIPTPPALDAIEDALFVPWSQLTENTWTTSMYKAELEVTSSNGNARYSATYDTGDFFAEYAAMKFLCEAGIFHDHPCTRIESLVDKSLSSDNTENLENLTINSFVSSGTEDNSTMTLTMTVRPATLPESIGTVVIQHPEGTEPVEIINHNGSVVGEIPNGSVCNKLKEEIWEYYHLGEYFPLPMYEIDCPESNVRGWVEAEWTE